MSQTTTANHETISARNTIRESLPQVWKTQFPHGHPFRGLTLEIPPNDTTYIGWLLLDGTRIGSIYCSPTSAKPWVLEFNLPVRSVAFKTLQNLFTGSWLRHFRDDA